MSALVNVALFGIFLLIFIYRYFNKQFNYFKKQGINGPKPIPIFGTYWAVWNKEYHKTVVEDLRKYGKVFGEFEGNTPALMVSDIDLVKQILIKDFDCFANRRKIFANNKYLQFNMGNMETEEWKVARSSMTPAFSSGKLKKLLEPMVECADSMIDYLNILTKASNSADINIKAISTGYTLDVIASCVFAIKIKSLQDPDNQFVQRAMNVLHGQPLSSPMANMGMMLCNFYPKLLKLVPASAYDDLEFFAGVGKQIIKEKKSRPLIDQTDFLGLLLNQAASDESSPFKDDDKLFSNMLLFLLAGFDTPATAMGFMVHCLAMHQDIQNKLREEIKTALEKHGGLTYDCLDIPYLDQCLSESSRMYPTNSKIERVCNKTITYGKIRIEKGTLVSIPIYGIHHDPDNYPNPEIFDPERFSQEEKAKRDPLMHIPFGSGPRGCIGKRFAYDLMKIGIIKLLTNFRFVPNKLTQDPPIIAKGLYLFSALIAPELSINVERCK